MCVRVFIAACAMRAYEHPASSQVMIRHGDRTPCNVYECWPNDTAVYNCSHSAVMTQTDDDGVALLPVSRVYRKVRKPPTQRQPHVPR